MSRNVLNEATIQLMLQSAIEKAAELGITISVAVADRAGHLLGFRRHTGAELVSIALAQDKAYTAVLNRMSTAELGKLCQPGEELYGLQFNLGGRMVIFGGGIPIRDAKQVLLGAIGVSGGTVEQDVICAEYALAAAMKQTTDME
ncbi:heme-binding protein [Paenibacillus sp. GCM10027628]|uniref:GlcG/HbpS family heme-binding protein n=1 Tax=Paenibacillus sp. GCM10027628 TaxID=3273413 RepID=UPI00363D3DBC